MTYKYKNNNNNDDYDKNAPKCGMSHFRRFATSFVVSFRAFPSNLMTKAAYLKSQDTQSHFFGIFIVLLTENQLYSYDNMMLYKM